MVSLSVQKRVKRTTKITLANGWTIHLAKTHDLPSALRQWWHHNFFVGSIEGAKCDSEGQKSKNLPKVGDFGHLFLRGGGARGAEPPTGGRQIPPCPLPLDAATALRCSSQCKVRGDRDSVKWLQESKMQSIAI